MSQWTTRLIETNRVPDWLVRGVVCIGLMRRLKRQYGASLEKRSTEKRALLDTLHQSPIAIHTDEPNRQHF